MRGFLSGSIWGLVLGGVSVSAASLVGEQPARNDPPDAPQIAAPAAQVETQDGAAPDVVVAETPAPETAPVAALAPVEAPAAAAEIETETVAPEAPDESVAEAPTTAPVTSPDPIEAPTAVADVDADVVDPAPLTETDPAALPVTGTVASDIAAPAAPDAGTLDVTAETPVFPNPQAVAPQAPASDAPVVVDTASADPLPEPAPVIVDDAPEADGTPAQSDDSPELTAEADPALITPQAPLAPAAPETSDTAAIAGADDPVAPDAAPSDTAPADDPVVVAIVDEPDSASALPTGTGAVVVNRFGADDDTADEAADAPADAETFAEGTPALVRYAADGSNPQARPEVSVVLMDDGSFAGAVAAVSGVAFPVTVMLNPSTPNVTERMRAYRAAGIEVGVLAALPASATPADVEVFFEAAFATLPETVAVLDAGEAGLQADADVISQAIAALAEDGRGLLTVSRGLNTALRTAEAQGVPTGVIYRNLDGEGQDARVIRRFMDQAAFKARQESGVVLLGQIRGETISALIQWGAANRASQVAMVPISKVLLGD